MGRRVEEIQRLCAPIPHAVEGTGTEKQSKARQDCGIDTQPTHLITDVTRLSPIGTLIRALRQEFHTKQAFVSGNKFRNETIGSVGCIFDSFHPLQIAIHPDLCNFSRNVWKEVVEK